MKVLLLLLVARPVYSNTFKFLDTSARFSLNITKERLIYKSETMDKEIALNQCNFPFAEKLNAELLFKVSASVKKQGFKAEIDGEKINVSGSLLESFLLMDSRIVKFMIEEGEACK